MNMMESIKTVDPLAKVMYSDYTDKYYVESRIGIKDAAALKSVIRFHPTPAGAVKGFFEKITSLQEDQVLISYVAGSRKHWKWTGSKFVEH